MNPTFIKTHTDKSYKFENGNNVNNNSYLNGPIRNSTDKPYAKNPQNNSLVN